MKVIETEKLQIEKVIDVSPNSFYPVPKVKSTVLQEYVDEIRWRRTIRNSDFRGESLGISWIF